MKNYLLSLLLLVSVAPSMFGMDDGQAGQAPRPVREAPIVAKEHPDIIFDLLMNRLRSPHTKANLINQFSHEHNLDLNMAKMVADRFGTRLTPPLASIGFEITPDEVETLIASGADVNAIVYAQNKLAGDFYNPMTILTWFISVYLELRDSETEIFRAREIIRLLIARGAHADREQCELLVRTLQGRLFEQGPLVMHILRARNNPYSQLVDAIDCGDCEAIALLCTENKALINQRDEFGFTPLGYALLRSTEESGVDKNVVHALLSLGAEVNAMLFDGFKGHKCTKSALDIALEFHWDDVVDILADQHARLQHATTDQDLLRRLIDRDYECSVCFKDAGKIPLLRGLACGHIVCQKCAQGLNECPLCRAPIR